MVSGKTSNRLKRGWLFLSPSLLGMIVFVTIPIVISIYLSFTQWNLLGPIQFIGIENYTKIFKDPSFYVALKNTLHFIGLYLPNVMVFGLLIAILLNQGIRGKSFFRAIYFLPVITSWVAVSVVWRWVFNGDYGLFNYLLSLIGIQGPSWLTDPKWAMTAVIITSIWKDMGFVAVIYLTGLQEIPEMYYEAAKIDGASALQRLFKITIPLLARTIHFILVISIINSFQVFDQVWVMTQGGPAGSTSVLVEQIYRNAFRYYKMGPATALSWILFAMIFATTWILNQVKQKVEV